MKIWKNLLIKKIGDNLKFRTLNKNKTPKYKKYLYFSLLGILEIYYETLTSTRNMLKSLEL